MKKIFASALGVALLATPALALAQSAIPIGQTPLQLLTTVATLEAQEAAIQNNESLACVALFSAPSVSVGQQVALAWGSVGALDPATASSTQPMWTPEGATMVSLQQPGTWMYTFNFYSASGATTTCTAQISVT